MANRFERLTFTKDWRNAKDFATYEGDETKVREDMQFLFNELRDALNNFMGQVETMAVPGTGDMRAEVYDPEGKGIDVYKYADDAAANAAKNCVTEEQLTEAVKGCMTEDDVNKAISAAIGTALEQEY